MSNERRPLNLHVKISPQERQRLRELSEADGIDVSDVVRSLVNRAHASRFGRAKAKTKLVEAPETPPAAAAE